MISPSKLKNTGRMIQFYRLVSFTLLVLFLITGLLFLFFSQEVISFFNSLSLSTGFNPVPLEKVGFFQILAVAYMYIVSILSFLMFRKPERGEFPLVLAHAKIFSSLLSLGFFFLQGRYLIYLANFLVDGLIGLGVVGLIFLQKRFLS